MLPFFCSLFLAVSPLSLQDGEAHITQVKPVAQSNMKQKRAPRKNRSDRGPSRPVNPPNPMGSIAEHISFSTTLAVAPVDEFAFFASNSSGVPSRFTTCTVNPFPPNYTSSFLVPTDGVISNLTVRIDFTSLENITPSFTFTVYKTAGVIGSAQPVSCWTPVGLSLGTGAIPVSAGSSLTAAFQNEFDVISVNAGDMLTIVVTPSGYRVFDIQPATFAATLKYTSSPS